MHSKNARLMAIATLRNNGVRVSHCAGYIGLARKLGLSVRPNDHSDAKRKLCEFFSGTTVKYVSGRRNVQARKKTVDFYQTDEWRALRYQALVEHGGRCQCCGASRADGVVLHVDHVKPRSKYPELALTLSNLQVLCEDCNKGKSNRDETDWRINQEYSDSAIAKKLRMVV